MPYDHPFRTELMDLLPHAILVIDMATREIVYANAPYRQTFSGGAAARLAVSLFDRDAEQVGMALSGDGPYASGSVDSEAEVENNTGHLDWVRFISRIITFKDRRCLLTSIHGIDRPECAGVDLKASETVFRLLSENTNDLISISTHDGTFTYASPSHERLLGYRPEELLGRSILEFMHPDDRANSIARNKEMASTGGRFVRFDCRFRHKAGHWEWVEVASSFQRDRTGSISAVSAVVRVITERVRAEEALRASEAKFRHLSENANDLIGSCTYDGAWTYLSPSHERLLGYRPEELLGRSNFEFMHPEDRQAFIATFKDVSKSGQNYSTQSYRVLHKSGHWEWVESAITLERDGETGRISTVSGVARLITERKRGEEALRASEEKFQLISESANDMICITSGAVFTYVSPSFERLLGYRREEMLGRSSLKFIHPDDVANILARYEELLSTGEQFVRYDCRFRHKAGHWEWVEIAASLLKDSAGKATGTSGVARLITARKRGEEALRASEEKFQLISESANDMICLTSGAVFTYVSPSYERLLGYRREEMLGRSSLKFIHPDDVANILARYEELLSTGEQFVRYDCRFRHKAGHWEWVEIAASILRDGAGKATGVSGVARLVTERVRTEAALKASEAEALRASEAKFRNLSENANDMISNHTPDGTFLYASPSFERLTGYHPDEYIGRNMKDFVHPDDFEPLMKKTLEALLGHKPYFTGINRVRHKSGH